MKRTQLSIVIALGILLIISGGVLVWQKKQIVPQPKQETQTVEQPIQTDEVESVKDLVDGEYTFTPIDTSDWQTYRNEELGFEVKVPKNFEKTEQGFTPKNPIVGNPESVENNTWFLIEIQSRLKQKNLNDISQKELFDPLWSSDVDSGNVNVSVKRSVVHEIPMILVKSIFDKEPSRNDFGGWIEGAYADEAFFQCNKNIYSIQMSSHTYSQDKQVLFYTVLSTLRLIQ